MRRVYFSLQEFLQQLQLAKIRLIGTLFHYKLTIQLIRENQVVITESLAVKNMIKNPKLSKSISDCAWGELIRQLDYKASWYGRILVQVDGFFPSSKRCHACGHVLDKLPLEIREWDCICGSHNLRDYNATLNLLAVGRTVGEGGFNKPRSMHHN